MKKGLIFLVSILSFHNGIIDYLVNNTLNQSWIGFFLIIMRRLQVKIILEKYLAKRKLKALLKVFKEIKKIEWLIIKYRYHF